MKSKSSDLKVLIIFMTSYFIFILIRDVFEIPIHSGFFLVLLFFTSLIVPLNQITAIVSFLIVPNMNMTFSTIAFIMWIVILFRFHQKIQLGIWLIPTILLIFIEGISFHYGYFSLVDYLSFIAVILLVVTLINNSNFMERPKLIMIAFIFGTFTGTISILLQTLKFYNVQEFINLRKRLGPTDFNIIDSSIHMNPNTLGMVCSVAITLIILLIVRGESKLLVASCLWFTSIGLLTLSKTYYFSLVFIFVCTAFYFAYQNKKILRSLLGILGLGFLFFIMKNQIPSGLIENLVRRFSEGEFTTGRTEIFNSYNQVLADNPAWIVLGSGLQNYSIKAGMEMSIHNAIQQIYFTWGIFGLIVSLMFFYQVFTIPKLSINKEMINLFYFLPYLNLLLIVQSSRFFSTYSTIFLLIPVIAGTLYIKQIKNRQLD